MKTLMKLRYLGCVAMVLLATLSYPVSTAYGQEQPTTVSPYGWHTETVVNTFYRYTCTNGKAGHSYDMDKTYRVITFANGFTRTARPTGAKKLVTNPCSCEAMYYAFEYVYEYSVN